MLHIALHRSIHIGLSCQMEGYDFCIAEHTHHHLPVISSYRHIAVSHHDISSTRTTHTTYTRIPDNVGGLRSQGFVPSPPASCLWFASHFSVSTTAAHRRQLGCYFPFPTPSALFPSLETTTNEMYFTQQQESTAGIRIFALLCRLRH